jgi:thiamine-triphosphatase
MLRTLKASSRGGYAFPRVYYCFNRMASSHSGREKICCLEVERKFLATPLAISYLRSNGGGSPGFKKHENLGMQTTHDIYYDQNGLLFAKGVYIRRRNGNWEVKMRTAGDFINSAFTEVQGSDAVKEVIEQNLTISADGLGIEEMLEPCADFVTERESWMIDGRFKIDVDRTDFGHVVGEVELTATLQYAIGQHGEVEEERQRILREKMDQEIEVFMQSYPQAFPAGRPLGKLSAYFQRQGRLE